MKKIAATTLAVSAVAITGLVLAPAAVGDPPPPPIPEGQYIFHVPFQGDTLDSPRRVAYCGPSCFSLISLDGFPMEFRFDPATREWQGSTGLSTVDGVHYGAATLTPA
jgi:hypothetical protein